MTAPTLTSSLRLRRRDGDALVRAVGPAARTPFSPLPADLQELAGRETETWRWHCGEGTTSERRYAVPEQARSLADLALTAPKDVPDWQAAVQSIGAALGRLHTLTPRLGPNDGPPQGLHRVRSFLTGEVPDGRPSALREHCLAHLSSGMLDALLDDCDRAMTPRAGVRSHGWAGLSRWFPHDGGAVGLVGEDLGLAAPEHDLAAVLAQVAELGFFRAPFRSFLTLDDARVALLRGYPVAVDHEWLDREVRLGVVRHVHDVFVHATCPDDEPPRWADLISTLPAGSSR